MTNLKTLIFSVWRLPRNGEITLVNQSILKWKIPKDDSVRNVLHSFKLQEDKGMRPISYKHFCNPEFALHRFQTHLFVKDLLRAQTL